MFRSWEQAALDCNKITHSFIALTFNSNLPFFKLNVLCKIKLKLNKTHLYLEQFS